MYLRLAYLVYNQCEISGPSILLPSGLPMAVGVSFVQTDCGGLRTGDADCSHPITNVSWASDVIVQSSGHILGYSCLASRKLPLLAHRFLQAGPDHISYEHTVRRFGYWP